MTEKELVIGDVVTYRDNYLRWTVADIVISTKRWPGRTLIVLNASLEGDIVTEMYPASELTLMPREDV